MTNSTDRLEIITSVQRRRRWTAPEKVRMVEETFEPVAPNQPIEYAGIWAQRNLPAKNTLTAIDAWPRTVGPASSLPNRVRLDTE